MAHNNAIARNKIKIQGILSADPQFILDKVRGDGLINDREYKKIATISKGDADEMVTKLVDTLNNKGDKIRNKFIGVLQDETVLETYPELEDVEWGDSGSQWVASSSSLKRSAERSCLSHGKTNVFFLPVYFYVGSKLKVC